MRSLWIDVSAEALNWLYLALLYTIVGGGAFRWLFPRLIPNARLLAAVLLAAQILVIFIAETIEAQSAYVERLWALLYEWNIPTTLAFTQLATVGGLAILLGWLARGKPAWHRLYLVALGFVFLFLSVDEYFKVHEVIELWYLKYAAAGLMVALISAIAALRSPGSARLWYAVLLGGLAMGALGGIVFERVNRACGGMLFLRFSDCFHFYVWEEAAELVGIWLALVAMLGLLSELRPPPSRRVARFALCLPLIALLMLLINAVLPSIELPLLARRASVVLEDDVRLRGYNLNLRAANQGWISARLYFSAKQKHYLWLGYSIHLVDQARGNSVASGDSWMDRQHGVWLLGAESEQVYRQTIDVSIPPGVPRNRAYWVLLTLWRPLGEGYASEKIFSSDHQLLSDTQVALGEIVLQETPKAATSPALAKFDAGFALVKADLPEKAKAGETLGVAFTWRADSPVSADYMQFLHLGNEDSGEWFVYDQQPLGRRLPTRLWYSGLADSETWQVPLPADLAPGRYSVYTGLYDAREGDRLPARGNDGSPFADARVPLGKTIVIHN